MHDATHLTCRHCFKVGHTKGMVSCVRDQKGTIITHLGNLNRHTNSCRTSRLHKVTVAALKDYDKAEKAAHRAETVRPLEDSLLTAPLFQELPPCIPGSQCPTCATPLASFAIELDEYLHYFLCIKCACRLLSAFRGSHQYVFRRISYPLVRFETVVLVFSLAHHSFFLCGASMIAAHCHNSLSCFTANVIISHHLFCRSCPSSRRAAVVCTSPRNCR